VKHRGIVIAETALVALVAQPDADRHGKAMPVGFIKQRLQVVCGPSADGIGASGSELVQAIRSPGSFDKKFLPGAPQFPLLTDANQLDLDRSGFSQRATER
jgi:hypothetical protein